MAKLIFKYFKGKKAGEADMSKAEIVAALKAYKAQNPAKYKVKKEALFARYGLTELAQEQVEEQLQDANDEELETLTKKVTKTKKAK